MLCLFAGAAYLVAFSVGGSAGVGGVGFGVMVLVGLPSSPVDGVNRARIA